MITRICHILESIFQTASLFSLIKFWYYLNQIYVHPSDLIWWCYPITKLHTDLRYSIKDRKQHISYWKEAYHLLSVILIPWVLIRAWHPNEVKESRADFPLWPCDMDILTTKCNMLLVVVCCRHHISLIANIYKFSYQCYLRFVKTKSKTKQNIKVVRNTHHVHVTRKLTSKKF